PTYSSFAKAASNHISPQAVIWLERVLRWVGMPASAIICLLRKSKWGRRKAMTSEFAVFVLGLSVVGAPFALLCVLGLFSLIDRPLSERATDKLVFMAIFAGLLSALGMVAVLIHKGEWRFTIELGSLLDIERYHFSVKLLFD